MWFYGEVRLMTVSVKFMPEYKQDSEYDWVNFEFGNEHVGKCRCRICSKENCSDIPVIVIHNINIYPEWQGRGFGREFVEYCKNNFAAVTADRVRAAAVGFRETMGFSSDNQGNYVYAAEQE